DGVRDIKNVSDLVGINIWNQPSLTPPSVSIVPSYYPLFTQSYNVAPPVQSTCCDTFYAADPSASVLGFYPGTQMVSMALKVFPAWKSIWSSTVTLPPAAFRDLARFAGVQVYNDYDEPFYMNKSFTTVVANSSGTRTIHYPSPVNVYE